MSKHTPGPWHCSTFRENGADPRFNGIDIGSDDNLTIGLVMYQRDELTPLECKANARLIAAAPEMAELLDRIADGHDAHASEASALLAKIDGQ